MACIDRFSKYAVVVPIKTEQEGDAAAGILECIDKMGETPKNYIYIYIQTMKVH